MDEPLKTPRSSIIWFVALVVATVGAYAYVNRAAPTSIAWGDDLAAAQTVARSRGTAVLLDFTMAGCVYCRKMELEVFPRPEVREAADQFVPVKVTLEKDRDIVMHYGVDTFPTFLVVDADGRIVTRAAGGLNAEQFTTWLRKSSEIVSRLAGPSAVDRSTGP